ncbi:MAG: AraC family transcriptional regulator [Clostridia bacterium]|nr:AraC family transcriptional regulator [Clostridia bacterium]
MLRQNEPGVLPGSEYFFNTLTAQKLNLFFSVSLCGHYYCDEQYCIERNYLDALLLVLVEKGTLKLQYHGKEYTASAGDILLFDCAVPQRYFADSYAEFYWIHFSGVNSLDLYHYLTRENGSVLYHAANVQKAATQVRILVRQFSTNQMIRDSEHSRLLYNTLCYLMEHNPAEAPLPENSPAQQAVKYIQSHLGEDLRLKRLAAEVHLSPSHLIRVFRSNLHVSPHEYIVRMRMDRAKYLLKSTDMPIKAIAAEIGYGTESSFTGAFTEKIGVSPRKFRELPLG